MTKSFKLYPTSAAGKYVNIVTTFMLEFKLVECKLKLLE